MPDRMPEDMPDRMPEDLPVTKRINVMVGITRSKVIFWMAEVIIFPSTEKKRWTALTRLVFKATPTAVRQLGCSTHPTTLAFRFSSASSPSDFSVSTCHSQIHFMCLMISQVTTALKHFFKRCKALRHIFLHRIQSMNLRRKQFPTYSCVFQNI